MTSEAADMGIYARIRTLSLAFAAALAAAGDTQSQSDNLAGKLLVATPEMADPRFAEAVIFMAVHNEQGAMGLIVNKPVKALLFVDLFDLLDIEGPRLDGELEVHFGGPVEPQLGFVLHSRDMMLEAHELVAGDLAVTTDVDMLAAIAGGRGPAQHLFALGYAGWGPAQLDGELGRGDWHVIAADAALVFADDPGKTWQRALAAVSTDL